MNDFHARTAPIGRGNAWIAGLRTRSRSIRFWLTWLVIACILPATLVTAVLLMRSYEQSLRNLDGARIGVARALMQAVDVELAGATSVLQVLAMSPLIATGDLGGFQALAARALPMTMGDSFTLSQPGGQERVNTLRPFGATLPMRGDLAGQRKVFETGKPVVSNVFIGAVSHRPVIGIEVPVLVNGEAIYSLEITFSAERLSEVLRHQNIPPGWVAAIFDQKGTLAARSRSAADFAGKPAPATAIRAMAIAPEGTFMSVNLEGVAVRAAFSRSMLSGWSVAISVPAEDVSAGLRRSLWLNVASALAVFMLGGELARRIGRRITRSITTLGLQARSMGSGGLVAAGTVDISEVEALRSVLLEAAALIEQRVLERDIATDAERRMTIAAEVAEAANRAKSNFLTGITHELRTPLHGILGYAELLSLEGGLNPLQAERVRAMMTAGEHLLGMINAVLDVSRIEAGQLELHPVEIELRDFAAASLNVVRPAAEAKGLVLVLAARPLRLFADPTRLRQVLLNLLGNAIKFTSAGSVELRLGHAESPGSGEFVRLEVADTGPGIEVGQRGKLFQSFERLDDEAVSAIEGAGMGLAIAARLVEVMGGRIGYAGNPGGGSVFWLELPAACAGTAAARTAEVKPSVRRPSLRVLVVDDDALNRSIASGFLTHGGHRVVCLDNGAAAVAAAASEDFDVILMDVRMPGMNGLEATRLIRALPGARGGVPVVAATAQAFAEQIEICRRAGMDTHVSKPFRQAVLLAAVEDIVPLAGEAIASLTDAEPELPVFDRTAFEDTAALFSPEDLREHLRLLIARAEAMLRGLYAPGVLARAGELAEAAHLLAGGAGTFGFVFVARAARRFEFAADSGSAETEVLAGHLAAATEAAVRILRLELAGMEAVAR
jgi:signal transduction histidine kinase/CheY-like chemotaxis protein/HPt (histidine-containing phosphotransfer) domain-containing protein